MPRGGARKGAGRPKGALTVRTRKIADEAAQRGMMPLEVMLDNMRFHYTEATEFMQRLIDRASEAGPIEPKELKGLLSYLEGVRSKAQDCARDAAPYLHPRLANVQVQAEVTATIQTITRKITD